MIHAAVLSVAALVATAAAESLGPAGEDGSRPAVVAVFDGGVVTADDLQREARFESADERRFRELAGHSAEAVRRDWTRRMVLRRAARRVAETEGRAAEPTLAERARQAGRRWWLARWRQGCYGEGLALPGDAELVALLGPPRALPERLRLSQIFLRASTPAEIDAAVTRLAGWRAEIDSLAAFQDRAERSSDSQTARRRGRLGVLHRGWLPPAAEEVLYELPTGAMSPPLVLRGGVHLFWVEARIPAETVPPDRAVAKLRREKAEEARDACKSRRLAAATIAASPAPPGELAVGERRLPAAVVEGFARPGEAAEEARRRWVEEEILYQSALALGAPSPEERRRLQDLEDDVWLQEGVGRRLEALLPEPTPEELHRLLDAEPERYRSPRRLAGRFVVARRPAGEDPLAFFDALAALAGRIRVGAGGWEETATLGRTGSFELQPALRVAGILGPLVFDAIQSLGPGEVAGPIQDGADFWLVRIDGEEPQRRLTFEEALPRLRADARRAATPALKARIVGELLAGVGFRFVEPELPTSSP